MNLGDMYFSRVTFAQLQAWVISLNYDLDVRQLHVSTVLKAFDYTRVVSNDQNLLDFIVLLIYIGSMKENNVPEP